MYTITEPTFILFIKIEQYTGCSKKKKKKGKEILEIWRFKTGGDFLDTLYFHFQSLRRAKTSNNELVTDPLSL